MKKMFFTRYLIVYDITDQKRLRAVYQLMKQYLFHVQYSVFEGELTKSQLIKLTRKLEKIINEKEDSVRIYPLTSHNITYCKILGQDKAKKNLVL